MRLSTPSSGTPARPSRASLSDAVAILKRAWTVQRNRRPVALLLVVATVLCGAAPAVIAQDYVIRDMQGRRTGTADRQGPDRYILRDPSGKRTGTIDQGTDGRLTIRNSHDRRVGTIEAGPSKDLVGRDTGGKRVETLAPQAGGSFAIHSPSGRRMGTVSRR